MLPARLAESTGLVLASVVLLLGLTAAVEVVSLVRVASAAMTDEQPASCVSPTTAAVTVLLSGRGPTTP